MRTSLWYGIPLIYLWVHTLEPDFAGCFVCLVFFGKMSHAMFVIYYLDSAPDFNILSFSTVFQHKVSFYDLLAIRSYLR